MIEIKDKTKCSGCHACFNICPTKCISMQEDNEGFWYPKVDKKKCIDCNLCEKHCPLINEIDLNQKSIVYGCYNKDDKVRSSSSSGGVFTILASYVIKLGGVVYGAGFNSKNELRHLRIDKEDDLYKLRGAKYIQSRINDILLEVKNDLKSNRLVYFSGTPCQIDGLLKYLNKNYDNLICQDFICHGVPSPKLWEMYLKKLNVYETLDSINFRDKLHGWNNYHISLRKKNLQITESHRDNIYMKAYLSDICLRPSCYDCKSKSLVKNSDITLGDFWGVEFIYPEYNDDKGISLVSLNSMKGKKIFDKIINQMVIFETDINEVLKHNPAFNSSSKINKHRKNFYIECNLSNFETYIINKSKPNLRKKIINKIKKNLKKLLKNLYINHR